MSENVSKNKKELYNDILNFLSFKLYIQGFLMNRNVRMLIKSSLQSRPLDNPFAMLL